MTLWWLVDRSLHSLFCLHQRIFKLIILTSKSFNLILDFIPYHRVKSTPSSLTGVFYMDLHWKIKSTRAETPIWPKTCTTMCPKVVSSSAINRKFKWSRWNDRISWIVYHTGPWTKLRCSYIVMIVSTPIAVTSSIIIWVICDLLLIVMLSETFPKFALLLILLREYLPLIIFTEFDTLP